MVTYGRYGQPVISGVDIDASCLLQLIDDVEIRSERSNHARLLLTCIFNARIIYNPNINCTPHALADIRIPIYRSRITVDRILRSVYFNHGRLRLTYILFALVCRRSAVPKSRVIAPAAARSRAKRRSKLASRVDRASDGCVAI